jgi:hypothetical protein
MLPRPKSKMQSKAGIMERGDTGGKKILKKTTRDNNEKA